MNEKIDIGLPVGKDLHDTRLYYYSPLLPKWIKIESKALQLQHLISNEIPVAQTNGCDKQYLLLEDVIVLSEISYFDKVLFYLEDDEAYIQINSKEELWLHAGWYDAKLFFPCPI